MIVFTTKIRTIFALLFVLFYMNNYAQILKSVSPLKVLNDKGSDIILLFENYELTKHPKPEIKFIALANSYDYFEDLNPVILNDSMLKVRYNPNGNNYFKITNETKLDINVILVDERGNAIKIIHPYKLSLNYGPSNELKVDSGNNIFQINKNNYPINLVARVTSNYFKTHFTHPSTKVFIKSQFTKATIKVDSFKAENDSIMRIYFVLDSKIETSYYYSNSSNFEYLYYVCIENDIDIRISSSSYTFNFGKPIVTYSSKETYTSLIRGDTGNIYTYFFTKKLNQTLPKPYQFTFDAYINDEISPLIKTRIISINADTQFIYIGQRKDTVIKYSVMCTLGIGIKALSGVYSLKLYNDSIGDIWLNNLFEIPKEENGNNIECNNIYTFPGFKESVYFKCQNKFVFKDSVSFVFYKNNEITNDLQIDSKIYDTLTTYKRIYFRSKSLINGIYDLKIVTKNLGEYYFPQLVIVSDLFPDLLNFQEFIFAKGETKEQVSIYVGYGFYQNYHDTIKNFKFFKNGLLTNKITYSSLNLGNKISVSNDAETGWYDVQFDTILNGSSIIQKNFIYVTGNYSITDFSPKEIVIQGKNETSFKVHFSKTNFTKASVIFFVIDNQLRTGKFNVINDTTVIFTLNEMYDIGKEYATFYAYNNIDGYMLDTIPIRIYETPIILSLSPNWGAVGADVDIMVKSYLSNYTELGSIYNKTESFSRNNNYDDANDIGFRERATIIDDNTLLVKIWISPKAKGTYDLNILEHRYMMFSYKKSLCFTVVPTGINENTIYKSIDIFPNPTENKLNINYDEVTDKISNIEIMDTKGAIVYQSLFKNELNLEEILKSKGLYLLILKGEKGVQVNKIYYK